MVTAAGTGIGRETALLCARLGAARFDTVELLVNNTDMGVIATFLDTELSDWRHLIDVNLMGVVHGCHCFVPRMVAHGRGGHVVNVASQAGFQANRALSA